MSENSTPKPLEAQTDANGQVPPTPGRCFRGALIAGGLSCAMYGLNRSIIQVLAGIPLPTKSIASANIAVAVRTLIVGISTLATAIFVIATLGLFALGVQLLIQQKQTKV
ncbi:MAG: DUF3082 domain-containing protein [Pegethrix bostrychoides GSE-TBD4-15B]|jgi:hypothetical protein|uniref:DUF3082 domain-containing protein n=1 Tax=Pegethrix bostrychoides GSE-TBD4-15B TaxID=2839662 RepID=A0A951U479_9CYAN|nr:DUF3082 domain-containing protein [Pegethrix bostrychoides GSE-TBD4-15B]